jgi:hypothetical protein
VGGARIKTTHFYSSTKGGQSGAKDPDWNGNSPTQVKDNNCTWYSLGSSLPGQLPGATKQQVWLPNLKYQLNDIVQGPGGIVLFIQKTQPDCTSGNVWNEDSNFVGSPVVEGYRPGSVTERPATYDRPTAGSGGVLWVFDGTNQAACTAEFTWKAQTPYGSDKKICSRAKSQVEWYNVSLAGTSGDTPPTFLTAGGLTWSLREIKSIRGDCHLSDGKKIDKWQANHNYSADDLVCANQAIYAVTTPGYSTSDFPFPPFEEVVWDDLGAYPPSTVSGSPAPELSFSILPTFPLQQTHTRFSYNVATGVLVTTIRSKSFAYSPTSTSPPTNSGIPYQSGSTLLIDPVISLTKYFVAFDAERRWRIRDLTPGLTLSISLTSPSSNFYLGGSSEVARYIQVEYGYALAKVPKLVTGNFVSSTSTSPPTTQVFTSGAYIGLSFNISGFLSGLGGGSKGSSGSSGSSSSGAGPNTSN